jgi:hypothetical protein
MRDGEVEFSFNASGWLQVFQLGAVHFLQRHIELADDKTSAVGTSAGATTAAVLLLKLPATWAAETACSQETAISKDFKLMVPVMHEAVRTMTPENAINLIRSNSTGFGIACTVSYLAFVHCTVLSFFVLFIPIPCL